MSAEDDEQLIDEFLAGKQKTRSLQKLRVSPPFACSFCGASQDEGARLIASAATTMCCYTCALDLAFIVRERDTAAKDEQAAQDARDRLLCEVGVAYWCEAIGDAMNHMHHAQRALETAIECIDDNECGVFTPGGASMSLWQFANRITQAARALGAGEE